MPDQGSAGGDQEQVGDDSDRSERAVEESTRERYILCLYVVGASPASRRAISTIREICDTLLESRYTLEVVDLHQQPQLGAAEQIVATPTLIRRLPAPIRRLVGDLSNRERVLVGLDLQPAD